MKIIIILLSITVIGIGGWLGFKAWWNESYPTGTWRYKMTVFVETPEGIKTGSAVREVTISKGVSLTPESTAVKLVRGEAVVVDLGQRGTLFAVMRDGSSSDHTYNIVFNAFPFPGETTAEGVRYYSHLKPGTKATLELKSHPLMVTFKDINDPKTVEIVYAAERYWDGKDQYRVKENNFEKLFDKGVKLKEVTIEITDEPIDYKLEKFLSWISSDLVNLDGTKTISSNEPSNYLNMSNFRIGNKK